jgi:hypothetical protein
VDPADPYHLDLNLDRTLLQPGTVVIEVVRHDRRSGAELLRERFRFRLQ